MAKQIVGLPEIFITLLSNSAGTIPPELPLTGQLWYNPEKKMTYQYNGTEWTEFSANSGFMAIDTSLYASKSNSANSEAPYMPVTGQLWYDTANETLNIWAGTEWYSYYSANKIDKLIAELNNKIDKLLLKADENDAVE